jgi:NAD-dependent dihydropyrimidine dehydrogenase PreA subunit
MSLAGWLVAYLFRWFPHASPTGLFAIGTPDESSPVIVTANFSLTVKRVRRALAGQNVWLLVANSAGINVWCAAAGGLFNESRVIDAVKVSRLSDRVKHRELILPALSAPGMDRRAIEEQTGFRAVFGPVYARDVPAYLRAGKSKTDAMRRFRFGLRHRLDMLLSMNLAMYLAVTVVLAIVAPQHLAGATLLFWGAVVGLYALVDVIPGRTGWGQSALAATGLVLAWAAIDWIALGDPLRHWGWFLAAGGVFFAAGFDLAGIATGRKSDVEHFLLRLGVRLPGLLAGKAIGEIILDRPKCTGCGTCRDVCPVAVYGDLDEERKTTFRDRRACFACGACVKQCPEAAFRLGTE